MTLLLLALVAAPLDLSLRSETPPPPAYTQAQADHDHRLGTVLRYTGASIALAGDVALMTGLGAALDDIGNTFGCGRFGLQRCAPQSTLAKHAGALAYGGLAASGVGLSISLYGYLLQKRAEEATR